MPRAYIIGLVLLAAGCGSERQYFKGVPTNAAPIAKTESFYVVDAEGPNAATDLKRRQTLTRLDPDGSITMIREIDPTLIMWPEVSDGNTVVMYGGYGKPPLLYTIATGELSPTADGYTYKGIKLKVEEHEFDSLTKIPFLKDLENPTIVRLYKPDYYLIRADVPDTSGSGISQSAASNTGDNFEVGCFPQPRIYWAIADMKNCKFIMQIDDAMPDFSASGKTIFFSVMPPDEKCYPYIVSLEDYLK